MNRLIIKLLFIINRFTKSLKLAKVLWRKWMIRVYYRHQDVAPAPVSITLRLTNNCNLRCVQCGQWGQNGVFNKAEKRTISRQLSEEEWKRFIKRVSPVCHHIYFFGGEPFLRKDLLELVKYATSMNMVAGVNTNGNFLAGKGEEIVKSNLDYIIISLDGPQEINDRIRVGKANCYSLVIEGIKELVGARKMRRSLYPLIEIKMTLTEENQTYIAETARIVKSLGVDYFSVGFGMFTTRELELQTSEQFKNDFGIDPKFYKGFVRDMSRMVPETIETQISEVKNIWGSRYKPYPPVKFSAFEYFHSPEKTLNQKKCIVPWISMQIMPNGDMAFCEDFPDLVAGNILTEDPLVIWNNTTSRSWRNRIRSKGIYPAETRCVNFYLWQ